jgi:transcriptional regulator with XRE-family HTH domain
MNVDTYLKKHGLLQKELADYCGKHPNYVYQCIHGYRNPSLQLATKIYEFCQGEVEYSAIRRCSYNCPPNCPCSQKKSPGKTEATNHNQND